MIRKIFSPPVFEGEEDNFRAKFINGFAWAVIPLLGMATIFYLANPADDYSVIIFSGLIVVMVIALIALHRGKVMASGSMIIILGWLGLGIQAYTADGVKDVILIAYIALSLFASIIIDWRTGNIVMLSSLAVVWALAILEVNGNLTSRDQNPVVYARDLSFIFIVTAILNYFHTNSLRRAFERASFSEDKLNITNQRLMDLNKDLEDRVAARTNDLEIAYQRYERRAIQFEAISQVARATTTNEHLEPLLPRLTALVSQQFGFYHAGIFLLDENREFAILRAANSEGGRRMLDRGHKLRVGQTGIVGFVAATGTPRIALDVGSDAVFFNNADLPNTRSEMALPLRIADQIIGVLDIQSIEPNAFQQEDVEVLVTLADQVAIAIQNARTYETMQKLLEKAQEASGVYQMDVWKILQSQNERIGYQVAGDEVRPLARPISSTASQKAVNTRQTIIETGETARLAVPIRMRDDVIGVMDIHLNEEHDWDEDEVDIAEAVADRLSLALETSLLLKSTQRRAEIERITADISGRIGATSQFDSILRTAAEELSRVLGGSEVLVQIQPDVLSSTSDYPADDGNEFQEAHPSKRMKIQ
ncbi:MAG: hypothetical protein C3F07_01580 [Anaerolineales bacterium]|nr:MAG: hypothetical protein C3F07_01580 [Anaerolineales bacterium]